MSRTGGDVSFQRPAESGWEELQWGKGNSKEEGKKTEGGTARGREGDTKRESQRVNVTTLSGVYGARKVYILL